MLVLWRDLNPHGWDLLSLVGWQRINWLQFLDFFSKPCRNNEMQPQVVEICAANSNFPDLVGKQPSTCGFLVLGLPVI